MAVKDGESRTFLLGLALESLQRKAARKGLSVDDYVVFLDERDVRAKERMRRKELETVLLHLGMTKTRINRPVSAPVFCSERSDVPVLVNKPVIKYVTIPLFFSNNHDVILRNTKERYKHIAQATLDIMRSLSCEFCGHTLEAHTEIRVLPVTLDSGERVSRGVTKSGTCVQCSCESFVPKVEELTQDVMRTLHKTNNNPFRYLLFSAYERMVEVVEREKLKTAGVIQSRRKRSRERYTCESRKMMNVRYEASRGFSELFGRPEGRP